MVKYYTTSTWYMSKAESLSSVYYEMFVNYNSSCWRSITAVRFSIFTSLLIFFSCFYSLFIPITWFARLLVFRARDVQIYLGQVWGDFHFSIFPACLTFLWEMTLCTLFPWRHALRPIMVKKLKGFSV